MVPTGAAPACSGPRPIVEYAHGDQPEQGAEHRRHHQHLEHRRRPDRRHVRGAGLHRGGAELCGLRHLDARISSVPERRPAVGRDDGHSRRGRAHRAARRPCPRPRATTDSCSSPATPRAATSPWRRCAPCRRRARRSPPPRRCPAPMPSKRSATPSSSAASISGRPSSRRSWSNELSACLRQRRQHARIPVFSSTYAGAETLLPSDTPIDTLFQEGLLPETALFDSTTPVVRSPAKRTVRRADRAPRRAADARSAAERADAHFPAGLRQSLPDQQRFPRGLRGGCARPIRTARCRRRRRACPAPRSSRRSDCARTST